MNRVKISGFICFFIVSLTSVALAQTLTLTGVLTDLTTGEPIPFGSVYLNGTSQGTSTNELGSYTLTAVPLGTVEVVASSIGYQTVKKTMRLTNSKGQTVDFVLKPADNQLAAVTVRASRDKVWERQRRQFEKQLLGNLFGDQCEITNAYTLQFQTRNTHLTATATEPLRIDNNALGYRLTYDMQHFDATSAKVFYGGTSQFVNLLTTSPKQADRYRQNRMRAYWGSTRHLLASLINGTWETEGFLVYYEDLLRPISTDTDPPTLYNAISRFRRLIPVNPDSLIRPGPLPNERRLVTQRPLVIFYTKATSAYSPYRDARYAYSQLRLPQGEMLITTDGLISQPNGMEMKGSLADDRLSTLLPADWQPERTSSAGTVAINEKPTIPADAGLQRIRDAFGTVSAYMAPPVFVQVDKPFYTTGDRLWLSAYVLDAVTNQLLADEAALHVELLNPVGQLVQHQWLRAEQGRAEGSFRLSDTLASGNYYLRAYTEADRNAPAPAFERFVVVYNGAGKAVTPVAGRSNPYRTRADFAPRAASLQVRTRISPDSSQLLIEIGQKTGVSNDTVYMLIQQGGRLVWDATIYLTAHDTRVAVPVARLPAGLVQVLLYNAKGQLLTARPTIVLKATEPITVMIKADKAHYVPRESIGLAISLSEAGQPVAASFSVSVLDADQVPVDTVAVSFLTHLVMAHNPYVADSIVELSGVNVTGQLLRSSGEPFSNVQVVLSSFDMAQPFVKISQTDTGGRFRLTGLPITDTLTGYAQVSDQQSRKLAARDAQIRFDTPGYGWPVDILVAPPDWTLLSGPLKASRERQLSDPVAFRDNTARQLAEVKVKARKIDESDQAVRQMSLHSGADEVIKFSEKQGGQFGNLYEMLAGRAAGVVVHQMPGTSGRNAGYSVAIRGVGSANLDNAPLFLIDGMPIAKESLAQITPNTIERIEVLKNAATAGVYGVRGGNGVIAFYTRRGGRSSQPPAVFPVQLIGYSGETPSFSVPRQDEDIPATNTTPDRRDVLYWKPLAQTDSKGQAGLLFPISDIVRTLRVQVEGITQDGRPVSATVLIPVR